MNYGLDSDSLLLFLLLIPVALGEMYSPCVMFSIFLATPGLLKEKSVDDL